MIKLVKHNFELIFWITAIIALAVSNPAAERHFSLCIFKLAGINWCPGCGIGHAIGWLLHGEVSASLQEHWLGLPALGVIIYRIYGLSLKQMTTFKKLNLNNNGV